ncbi:hypothetical protein VI26_22410 [Chromobacterium sp. LK1]|uniref:PIN domain-containing protein n=1 Tax=Chromobacterium sp. LK1 TaxID=1628193 RepID=UPI000653477F|nr:hypothetical protein [Chromobacterium sp. LK1]KMN29727.1 hypothetical protein VI26_22410 [Chromobacterium sp. LK1]
MKLFAGNASANNSSIAIAGDANAPVCITQNLNVTLTDAHVDRITDGLYRAGEASIARQLPSDQTARADSEKQIDGQIDAIRSYIGKKPSVALDLLEKLYASTASTASGRIRFRIKANIGICHHLLGNDEKAASYLCDAYLQAPEEPKAIANNVLGLVLSGDVKAAFKFGTEQLKLYPENETLAGYLVQCAGHLPEVEDPLELVPPEQRKSSEVLTAYIYFLQKRGSDEKWWAVAWEGAEQYKDDEALQYDAALATLDKSSRDPQLKRTNALSAGQHERLIPAIAVLKERWQQCLSTDEKMRPDQAVVGHNLLSAYLQLRDFDSIRQFAAVALANPRCPSEVLEHVGRLSFLTGDIATTRVVLAKAKNSATLAFLKFHLAALDGDIASIAATQPEVINGFPEPEQDWCRVLAAVSCLEVREQGFSEDELRTLLPLTRDSKRALILIARKARNAGFESLSTEVYDKASSLVTPDSDYAGRTTVAREAAVRRDWNNVVALLDGYVSVEDDSEELDMLALAFANITPPRARGVEFYKTLTPRLLKQHRYALFAGTLNYNRGALELAEKDFRQAFEASPRLLDGILALAQTYLRAENGEATQKLLETIDADAVEGSPLEKMHLAQLLVRFGRPRDGIKLGYRVLCSTVDSAKVNLTYVGLILNTETDVIPMPDVVGPGCWVRLENQDQGSAVFCLDDNGPDYRNERVSLDHPLAIGAMGLRAGESFKEERRIGSPIQWIVQQILDKHVRAMQDVMENYERRFPNHPGLWSVKVGKSEGDISGLLDIIKEQSERDRSNLDLYLEKHLPMPVVASILGLDVLNLASRIRHSGNPIISNTGRLSDLESAIRVLDVSDFELVVFDTYTAWSVVCSGMLPILARIFPILAVPRSVVDQLLKLHSEFDAAHDTDRMYLGWADGQFYRDTFTPEQLKTQGLVIRQRIDELCNACKVVPVDWKEKPAPLVQKMIDAVRSPHIFDAAYLAAGGNNLLLSEDLFYRQWVGLIFPNLHHAWLQAILKYAVEAKIITRMEYSGAITSLASFQHEYVSVDAATLVAAFEGDTTESLEQFSQLANCIGGKTPDWPSHINVMAEFLSQIVDSWFEENRTIKAVSMMTEKLLRHSGDNWPVIYAVLLVHPKTTEKVRTLLELWRRGHFLPLEPITKVLELIRDR